MEPALRRAFCSYKLQTVNVPFSGLTSRRPPENTDAATSHAPTYQIPANEKPIPKKSSGILQSFGRRTLKPGRSRQINSVLNLSYQVPPSELGGGQGHMNGFETIAGELVYQPDTSILNLTTVQDQAPLQTPHWWRHLLRPHPSGKVNASARIWSQNHRVSCMCSHGFCRSALTHSPSQPSRTCIRCGSGSGTPHPVGSGWPG